MRDEVGVGVVVKNQGKLGNDKWISLCVVENEWFIHQIKKKAKMYLISCIGLWMDR